MDIGWQLLASVLGPVGAGIGAMLLWWFTKVRTVGKLKALGEVDVYLKHDPSGPSFQGKCVDMIKIGARNFIKFDVAGIERLIPNENIVAIHRKAKRRRSPVEWITRKKL